MPSKYVPLIVLQVLTSTRTYRGSLRPPKRPSKAKNGQKITVFGLDRPILVWRPPSSGPNSGIHRRTYNSIRYPPYFEPFGRNGGEPPEKTHKLAYIPTIQYIYTKKVLDQNKKAQTRLKSFYGRQWDILQSISGVSGASGGLRSQNFDFWTQKFKMAVFARFHFLKSKNPISGHN